MAGGETSEHPLELSPGELRRLVEAAMERIAAHLESLPGQPVSDVAGGEELAREVVEPLPEAGTPHPALFDLLFDRLLTKSFNTASPGYLAFIPGGGLLHAAVADLIADAVNRYVGVWQAAPALATLEATVVRWFCRLVGYPPEARGFLTTGGSLANLTALVTARRERLPEDFLAGTLYASEEVHHSVVKAAALAGFPAGAVRRIPVDDRFRIRLDLLRRQVADDRRQGRTPFLVVGSVGTVNTGAVDDLGGLAELARDEGLWLHLDAAYGGFFALTERGRRAMAGIERSDSVTLDPHKGLFLPYGTGCLLVRDGAALKRAHSAAADYMPPLQDSPDRVDFCEISPELSRDFRGLRVWLPLKMHGAGAFRAELDEKLDLARWAAAEVAKIPEVAVVAEPQLSLFAFRLAPPGVGGDELDELNHRWLAAVNARQRVFLTGTVAAGRFALRICVLSFRTHRERMEAALEDLRAAAAEVTAEAPAAVPANTA
jgi:aromatic-L-amino-acid/L-tryptophan decarboxylase